MREFIESLNLDSTTEELIISEFEKEESRWAEIEAAGKQLEEKNGLLEKENLAAKEKESELLTMISQMREEQVISELKSAGLILGLEEFAAKKLLSENESGENLSVEEFKKLYPGFFISEKKSSGEPLPIFSSKIGCAEENDAKMSEPYHLNYIRRQ